MKILSVTAQKPTATGSGVYLTETVRGFASLGHSQAVIAGITEEADLADLPPGIKTYPVYFDTPELPFPIAGMSDEMPYPSTVYSRMTEEMTARFKAAFRRVLARAVAEFQPDVILCHHLYLLTSLIREECPALPVWGVCHGTDLRQMTKNPLWQEEIKAGISRLDKVFCLHEAQREQAVAVYGLDAAKTRVVANGYNDGIFFDRGARSPHREIRLVFAGKISAKKGVFSLLRALPLLGWGREDFSLRLCGGWPDETVRRQAEELIAAGGFDVTLLGNLPQPRLAEEFNRGDIFVLPSFYDGLPLVLAESLSCGMKAVCTDLPGIKDWLDANVPRHEMIFVPPPRMRQADEPEEADLPRFERDLALAIRTAAAVPRLARPDLSAVSWQAVCRKMLG